MIRNSEYYTEVADKNFKEMSEPQPSERSIKLKDMNKFKKSEKEEIINKEGG